MGPTVFEKWKHVKIFKELLCSSLCIAGVPKVHPAK